MDLFVAPKFGVDIYIAKVFVTTFLFYVGTAHVIIVSNSFIRETFGKCLKKWFCVQQYMEMDFA